MPENEPLRVAIYARVSKDEEAEDDVRKAKRQDTENQLQDLREFCARMDWEIAGEYVDRASGKSTNNRPEFKRLFLDASQRKFDVVLFWALDRLTREGTLETLVYLRRLKDYGVNWRSYTEPNIDSMGPLGDVFISFLATQAKMEREKISERTKAGLRRARRSGKRIGRPRTYLDSKKLQQMQAQGKSVRAIARDLDVSLSTLMRTLRKEREAA